MPGSSTGESRLTSGGAPLVESSEYLPLSSLLARDEAGKHLESIIMAAHLYRSLDKSAAAGKMWQDIFNDVTYHDQTSLKWVAALVRAPMASSYSIRRFCSIRLIASSIFVPRSHKRSSSSYHKDEFNPSFVNG